MYHQFSIQQFYVLPTQYIFVFCVGHNQACNGDTLPFYITYIFKLVIP